MLGLDELAEGVLGPAWGLPVAAVAAVAVIAGPRAKPLAKGAIKGYFAMTQRAREWVAETGEQLQDLYAEAKYEYESGLRHEVDGEPTGELAAAESKTDTSAESEPRSRRRTTTNATGLVTPAGEPA